MISLDANYFIFCCSGIHLFLLCFLHFLLLFYCSTVKHNPFLWCLEQARIAGNVTRPKTTENNCMHNLFSSNFFCICTKKKINECIKPLQSLKEDSSCKLFCHGNIRENAYRIYSCTSRIFWTWKWAQKIDLDLYSGEHETYLPNHKKMPKFTATSQVTELSK